MNAAGTTPCFRFLKPGELLLSDQPMLVTTLLGSCVAVTMYCARLRLWGICHALLPSCGARGECARRHEAGRFVECAIHQMLSSLASRGVSRGEIEAKLFGGADMFDTAGARRKGVGRQNLEMALGTLEKLSVRVATQDLGGVAGRKIIFHTHTGEVFLKRLSKAEY